MHQPASILRTGGISISNEMLLPLFLMAIGFLLLFIYALLVSVEIKIKEKKIIFSTIMKLVKKCLINIINLLIWEVTVFIYGLVINSFNINFFFMF